MDKIPTKNTSQKVFNYHAAINNLSKFAVLVNIHNHLNSMEILQDNLLQKWIFFLQITIYDTSVNY